MTGKLKNYFNQPGRIYEFALAGFVLFYLASRLWMVLRFGDVAFGYDFGIYRNYIEGYFARLGDPTVVPFGFSALSNILRLLGGSVDQILFSWYFVLSGLILIAVYYVVKNYFNVKTAVIATVLFSTSITQFEFHWWYYYRNFLALFFVLLSFLFLYHKSYFLVLALFFIGIVHPPSLIPLGLSLLVYLFVCDKEERKFLLLNGVTAFCLILILNWRELRIYLPFFTEHFGSAHQVAEGGRGEFNGLFLDAKTYLRYAVFYLPFGLAGLVFFFKKQKFLTIFFAVNFILMMVGFVLYRRLFVFFDLMLIIFASTTIFTLLERWCRYCFTKYVAIVFCGLLIVLSSWHIVHKKPLITPVEMRAIQTLSGFSDGEYTLTVSSNYAPWLLGYANKKIIAPGMFEYDKFSREEWQIFWFSSDAVARDSLLARYGSSPIYLFLGDRGLSFTSQISADAHFTRINKYLWRFDL